MLTEEKDITLVIEPPPRAVGRDAHVAILYPQAPFRIQRLEADDVYGDCIFKEITVRGYQQLMVPSPVALWSERGPFIVQTITPDMPLVILVENPRDVQGEIRLRFSGRMLA